MKILLLVFLTFVLCCCSGKKNSQTDGSSLQTSVLCDTIGGKVVFPNDIDSGCCMMFTRHKKVYLYVCLGLFGFVSKKRTHWLD